MRGSRRAKARTAAWDREARELDRTKRQQAKREEREARCARRRDERFVSGTEEVSTRG